MRGSMSPFLMALSKLLFFSLSGSSPFSSNPLQHCVSIVHFRGCAPSPRSVWSFPLERPLPAHSSCPLPPRTHPKSPFPFRTISGLSFHWKVFDMLLGAFFRMLSPYTRTPTSPLSKLPMTPPFSFFPPPLISKTNQTKRKQFQSVPPLLPPKETILAGIRSVPPAPFISIFSPLFFGLLTKPKALLSHFSRANFPFSPFFSL